MQLASCIQLLHTNSTIHRDISPDNILVNTNTTITFIINDFECGREIEGIGYDHTKGLGKIAYCAPEMLHGKYGFEVDVWSLGVVLFEVMTMQKITMGEPYLSQIICDMSSELKQHQILRMRMQIPGLYDESIIELVLSMLRFDPSARPSAEEVVQNVSEIVECNPSFDMSYVSMTKKMALERARPLNVLLLGDAGDNHEDILAMITSTLGCTDCTTSNLTNYARYALCDRETNEALNITLYDALGLPCTEKSTTTSLGIPISIAVEYIVKGGWTVDANLRERNWSWFYYDEHVINIILLVVQTNKPTSTYKTLFQALKQSQVPVIMYVDQETDAYKLCSKKLGWTLFTQPNELLCELLFKGTQLKIY
jgi:serine/threonine protein kinase